MKPGELYLAGRTKWREFIEYLHTDEGHELRIFMANPSGLEVAAVNEGDWQFSFYQKGTNLWFLFSGPFLEWSDSPFTYHLVPAARRALPSLFTDRAQLRLNLVDSTTGILAATRLLSLSPHFTDLWHKALIRQAVGCELPFDRRTYEFNVIKVANELTPKQMQRQAMASSRGGGLVLPGTGLIGMQ